MIGEVTRRMLPHLSGVPHLHVNRPLERWEDFQEKRLVSCWQEQKEGFCNDRSTTKKFPKHCQRVYQTQSPRTLWRANSASRIDCKRGSIYGCKHFPFDPECFWNFQPENLPKWKAPLITPLIKATRGLLRRSPQACTCMRGSQFVNRQSSKGQLFFTVTVSRQKCRLILTVRKFQGISNLAFFSISADRHGLLLLKNPAPNWKTMSHVLKTLLQDITRP